MSSVNLQVNSARELMTAKPVTISEHAAIIDAASLLANRDFRTLAVVNDTGRPVGVVSRTEIVRREAKTSSTTAVGEIMTATMVSVRAEAPASEVVAKMAAFRVHPLFVVDRTGVLIGVISAIDVVRKLSRTT
jgi:CBS domain-containing protein